MAKVLLDAGADPNALCSLYGGQCTTMALLVSSTPPDQAGVQVALVDVLVDYGASPAPAGEGNWTSPIETALVFGKQEAANALVRRGAPIDTVAAAAGLGRIDDVRRMVATAGAQDRHRALRSPLSSGTPGSSACCSMPVSIRTVSIRQAHIATRPRSTRRLPPATSMSSSS